MTTLKSLIIALFGSYSPIYYTDANGVDIIPYGISGVDFEWIAGVFLFALTLYCVFKIIGGIISNAIGN